MVLSVLNATVLMRLGNMQLDGLPTSIGATLALLAAITSLMFNRARAYPVGPVQRRSILAAELMLRATFLAITGAVFAAIIFSMLLSYGYLPTPVNSFPTQALPQFLAFIPALFFAMASLTLLTVGRVIAPTLLARIHPHQLRKAIK